MSVHADPPPAVVSEPHGSQYATGEQLGKGGFAICHRGEVLENGMATGRIVALKIVKAEMQSTKLAIKFRTELQLHSKLRHPNIVEFHRAFTFRMSTYVVLEICDNGSLADAIKRRKYFTMPEIRRFIIQTCGAVKYLHCRNIVHRDLKTGNLFLDRNMNIKVGDFGLAALLVTEKDIGKRRTTMCGTPNYLAPEILEKGGKGHNEKVDLWSIGIIAYTLAVGKAPFHAPKREDIYKKLQARDYTWPDVSKCLNEISNDLRDLVGSLLVHEDDRPGPDNIVSHPFFKMTFIPEHLDSSCTSKVPTWPNIRPPSAETIRKGYSDSWFKLCHASGVGEYEPGKTFQISGGKRVKSIVRDVEKELAAGRGPVVPMPENEVYVPFPGKDSSPADEERQLNDIVEERESTPTERTCKDAALKETSGNGKSLAPSKNLAPPRRAVSRSKALAAAKARLETKENAVTQAVQDTGTTAGTSRTRKTGRTQAIRVPGIRAVEEEDSDSLPTRGSSNASLKAAKRAVQTVRTREVPARGSSSSDKAAARRAVATVKARQQRADSGHSSSKEKMPEVIDLTVETHKVTAPEQKSESSPEAVLDRVSKLRDNLAKTLAGKNIMHRRTSRPTPLPYVANWVDYMKKLGIAYAMRNGTVGICQRSSTQYPALFWAVKYGRMELERQRRAMHNRTSVNLPLETYESDGHGGVRPARIDDDFRIQGSVWWAKLAAYMERSCKEGLPDGDKTCPSHTGSFVHYYQRIDGVLIFGFDNGAFQFNFPDHTKLVLSHDGLDCEFVCLSEDAWARVKRVRGFSNVSLQDRSTISKPVNVLLAAEKKGTPDSRLARVNNLPMKLRFVMDLLDEWISIGGLGCPPESKVRWEGEVFDRDTSSNAVVGGLNGGIVGNH